MIPTKLLTPTAILPQRGSEHAAGLDLFLDEAKITHSLETHYTIEAGTRKVFKTGISMEIPKGFYGQIAPRSGLAVKKGLIILAGIIDADYRGEIMVAAYNSGHEDIDFMPGDRIAQLLIKPVFMDECVRVEELSNTIRGGGKFGSTGA